jgi:hypothetical protein
VEWNNFRKSGTTLNWKYYKSDALLAVIPGRRKLMRKGEGRLLMDNKFPDDITIGEKYDPAMEITHKEEASKYLEKCVEHTMRFGKTREEAMEIELSNIGYYAGYYNQETANRVKELFGAVHPIFGDTDYFNAVGNAFKTGGNHGQSTS